MAVKEDLIKNLYEAVDRIILQQKIAIYVEAEKHNLDLYERIINHFKDILKLISSGEFSNNYINQFQNELSQTLGYIGETNNISLASLNSVNKSNVKYIIEKHYYGLNNHLTSMLFNFDFFNKLNFSNNNIVAVGANGSGKTSLSNNLKQYLPQSGVVIAAQKILIVPTFSGISNLTSTSQKLLVSQSADKALKSTYITEGGGSPYGVVSQLVGEFQVLLDNLLAERSAIRNQFCEALNNGSQNTSVPLSKLDKALSIWNSLIQHKTMECIDGINITLKSNTDIPYQAYQMSDGEKVFLYLIAQILQAPHNGFIIVDEPEMYLHKTILNKLWDILEKERQDCIFIYLTHDLDFATSRVAAKKSMD